MNDINENPWNTLELVKLTVQFLTPLTVVFFGWFISRHLKKLDLKQWSNQKIIEKCLNIYDEIAPKLNMLFCFYTWVGNWKEITPNEVIKAKRKLDKTINIYRHIFDEEVYESYNEYINLLFEHYADSGRDAQLLTSINGPGGNRAQYSRYDWKKEWEVYFFYQKVDLISLGKIHKSYYNLMEKLRNSIGLAPNKLLERNI
jgi:hypothetical protein